MPAPIPEPPPWPGENVFALDTEGEPPVEEPKPLHTSPTAPRVDGDAALARDAFFGATELANTGWPPRLVTPAVAPWTRAANCDDGEAEDPAPEPLLAPLPAERRLGVPAPLVCGDRVAPEVEPLATEPLPEPCDVEVLPDVADEEGLAATLAPLPGPATPPPLGDDVLVAGLDEGEVPDAGIPVSGVVQAQARLPPTTAVASIARMANEKRRR